MRQTSATTCCTTPPVKDFDVIVVEYLNVKGMARNKHLATHIHDASWSEFVRQLTYKAGWFYPDKPCSGCEEAKTKLFLTERTYHCETCGVSIDCDVNAAINLARLSEPASLVGQETRPAGTHSVDVKACLRPQPNRGSPRWLRRRP